MSENKNPITNLSSTPAPAASGSSQQPQQPAKSQVNHLSSDVEITGTLTFKKDLVFDGKMNGEITSDAALTLGANAYVEGEILTQSVVIRGSVKGNVTVEDKCELRGSAQLIGDLKAARLVMEESATLVGRTEVTPKKQPSNIARPSFNQAAS